jgi:hypothetical protein
MTVGIQNKMTRNAVLLSRRVVKNKAKKETARIQNKGEKRLSKSPPAVAAQPVALSWLICISAITNPGPSKAINIAANPLRTTLT